jgi:hypothetical protein
VKRVDWILLALVTVASGGWCFFASRQLGATFDEPFYLQGGLDYWHRGNFGTLLAAGTMPLAQHLQTLPIYIAEAMSGRLFTIEHDLGDMLALARPVTLLFWILLLVSTLRMGRILGGPWGARAALLLLALEPNFLAHACLATTDIALTACFMSFAVELLTRRRQTTAWRVGVPALWFGLALSAKVSAIALLPFAVVAAALQHDRTARRRLAIDAISILVLGLGFTILYSGTGGQIWLGGTLTRMPADHWLRPIVSAVGSLPLFPNALYAIWFQFAHNQTGQAVFLAGQADTSAIWYYVPVLLTVKLTVPMLAAFILAIALSRSPLRVTMIAASLLAATMIVFQVQTGIRFLLPLLAFALAWLGSRLGNLCAHAQPPSRLALAAILAAMTIEGALQWPDALRYVNSLWGGPNEGYKVVSDSNYDWGQGMPELERWRRSSDGPLSVWYFGTDTRYPEISRINPRDANFDSRVLEGRALAVSTSLLYGGYLETPSPARDLIQRLRQMAPSARTSTFFIFTNVR